MSDFAAFDRAFDEVYQRRPDTVLEGIAKFLSTAPARRAETSSLREVAQRQPVDAAVAARTNQRRKPSSRTS